MSCPSEAYRRRSVSPKRPWLAAVCGGATLLWLALGADAALAGLWKLLALSLLAAGTFIAGGLAAPRIASAHNTRVVDALASGAMLAGALVIIMPEALHGHRAGGALGILGGLVVGGLLHCGAHKHTWQTALAALCLHSLAAGLVLGLLYTRLPTLGIAVGLAVVAHKLPAGYLLGEQLDNVGRHRYPVILPALAVGLAALPTALWGPDGASLAGPTVGLACGLFLFVALLFIARLFREGTHNGLEWGAAGLGGLLVTGVAIIGYVLG